MSNVDLGICIKALLGSLDECGDIAVVEKYENQCFIALIDVLGHGQEAREVALLAKKYLENNYRNDLVDIMNGLHCHLKGTRGAVAAMCHFHILTGEFNYVGVGNFTVRVFGVKNLRLIPKGGVVGYMMTNPKKHTIRLHPDDTVLIHSDGIREHFDILQCSGLLKENSESAAREIVRKFGRKTDDISCVVLKYLV